MFDFSHPMFRPLWVRLLITGLTLGWVVVELVAGTTTWAMIVGAIAAVEIWGLFLTYDPDKAGPDKAGPGKAKPGKVPPGKDDDPPSE